MQSRMAIAEAESNSGDRSIMSAFSMRAPTPASGRAVADATCYASASSASVIRPFRSGTL
jgi:hypothetical protein